MHLVNQIGFNANTGTVLMPGDMITAFGVDETPAHPSIERTLHVSRLDWDSRRINSVWIGSSTKSGGGLVLEEVQLRGRIDHQSERAFVVCWYDPIVKRVFHTRFVCQNQKVKADVLGELNVSL